MAARPRRAGRAGRARPTRARRAASSSARSSSASSAIACAVSRSAASSSTSVSAAVRSGCSSCSISRRRWRDEHVEVAAAAERAAEPVQLVAQRLRPGRVEDRARGAQDRARPPDRHAHAVDVLGVEVEPDARIVAQDLGVLPLEHRAQAADRVVRRLSHAVRWCSAATSYALGVRPAQKRRAARRATSAGGVTGPPSCSTTSGSPWSRASSRRQMPFPCSRRRESAAPASSSRRSGRS